MRNVDPEILRKIESTYLELLLAHKSCQTISKTLVANLHAYGFSIEAEAEFCDQKELLIAHVRKIESFFGMLLSQTTPEDREFGRIVLP